MIPVEKDPVVRGWFEGRHVLVLGLGKSGVAAARLLAGLGARVAVTEKRSKDETRGWVRELPAGIPIENGTHKFLALSWDLLIVSPGVPTSLWAPVRARGVPVWGELELGYRILSLAGRWPAWSAAITGTNGKTTTTALLGAIFKASGRPTVIAGNIGVPLCAVVNTVTRNTALALEVSSYQLETAEAFRPAVGAVLNVTPDHLARHGTMDAYAKAKFRLFQSQGINDVAVLNAEDPWCRRLAPFVPGKIHWFGDRIPGPGLVWEGERIRGKTFSGQWRPPAHLPGRHNIDNALAAVASARALGVSAAAIARGLADFHGVEHRLERVRTWRGVRYINDSKATNVDSTRVALEAFSGPLTIILGGQDKGAPYTPLIPLLRKKAREILLIGEAADKIEKDVQGRVPLVRCETLARAVDRAAQTSRPGDVVLLSPACASFDQFENFEHRGRCFKELVGAL
ncbi:MAG: UDP-N-acetylmuramoyl-L-alanine--D-glutamate ligase [Elusimicrobia bacterium]|nr:UDP-N-acetylmuramoyl-L-alanine--D-glutamate ligase [Elusimicrobiota bacterium]